MKRKKNKKVDIKGLKNDREEFPICENCGNVRLFQRLIYMDIRETHTERYDAVKDRYDTIDVDQDDQEVKDREGYTCCICDSDEVYECDDQKEMDEMLWKHIDRKMKWNIDELDEKDRNKRLGKRVMVNNL